MSDVTAQQSGAVESESFKDQIAARYRERTSLGLVLPVISPDEPECRPSGSFTIPVNKSTDTYPSNGTEADSSSDVPKRNVMKDLITKFETKCNINTLSPNTTLGSHITDGVLDGAKVPLENTGQPWPLTKPTETSLRLISPHEEFTGELREDDIGDQSCKHLHILPKPGMCESYEKKIKDKDQVVETTDIRRIAGLKSRPKKEGSYTVHTKEWNYGDSKLNTVPPSGAKLAPRTSTPKPERKPLVDRHTKHVRPQPRKQNVQLLSQSSQSLPKRTQEQQAVKSHSQSELSIINNIKPGQQSTHSHNFHSHSGKVQSRPHSVLSRSSSTQSQSLGQRSRPHSAQSVSSRKPFKMLSTSASLPLQKETKSLTPTNTQARILKRNMIKAANEQKNHTQIQEEKKTTAMERFNKFLKSTTPPPYDSTSQPMAARSNASITENRSPPLNSLKINPESNPAINTKPSEISSGPEEDITTDCNSPFKTNSLFTKPVTSTSNLEDNLESYSQAKNSDSCAILHTCDSTVGNTVGDAHSYQENSLITPQLHSSEGKAQSCQENTPITPQLRLTVGGTQSCHENTLLTPQLCSIVGGTQSCQENSLLTPQLQDSLSGSFSQTSEARMSFSTETSDSSLTEDAAIQYKDDDENVETITVKRLMNTEQVYQATQLQQLEDEINEVLHYSQEEELHTVEHKHSLTDQPPFLNNKETTLDTEVTEQYQERSSTDVCRESDPIFRNEDNEKSWHLISNSQTAVKVKDEKSKESCSDNSIVNKTNQDFSKNETTENDIKPLNITRSIDAFDRLTNSEQLDQSCDLTEEIQNISTATHTIEDEKHEQGNSPHGKYDIPLLEANMTNSPVLYHTSWDSTLENMTVQTEINSYPDATTNLTQKNREDLPELRPESPVNNVQRNDLEISSNLQYTEEHQSGRLSLASVKSGNQYNFMITSDGERVNLEEDRKTSDLQLTECSQENILKIDGLDNEPFYNAMSSKSEESKVFENCQNEENLPEKCSESQIELNAIAESMDGTTADGDEKGEQIEQVQSNEEVAYHFGITNKEAQDADKGASPTTALSVQKNKMPDKIVTQMEKSKKIRKVKKKIITDDTASTLGKKRMKKIVEQKEIKPPKKIKKKMKNDQNNTQAQNMISTKQVSPKLSPPKAKGYSTASSLTSLYSTYSIHYHSPPHSPHYKKQLNIRPVRRLSVLPDEHFPTWSKIPLIISQSGSTRLPLKVIMRYRRWREGYMDSERPSKIPLSESFSARLDGAVLDEWAMHSWCEVKHHIDSYRSSSSLWSSANEHNSSRDIVMLNSLDNNNRRMGYFCILRLIFLLLATLVAGMGHLLYSLHNMEDNTYRYDCKRGDEICQLKG